MRTRAAWGTAAALVVAIVLLAGAPPAAAHARLGATTPGDGAEVSSVRTVELRFTDAVEPALGTVRLADGAGRQRPVGPLRPAPGADGTLVADVGRLPPGRWHVTWRVASGDSHPLAGTFSFTVVAPDGDTGAEPAPARTGHGSATSDAGHRTGDGPGHTPGAVGMRTPADEDRRASLAALAAAGRRSAGPAVVPAGSPVSSVARAGSAAAARTQALLSTLRLVGFVAVCLLGGLLLLNAGVWPDGARDRRARVLLPAATIAGVASALASVPLHAALVAGAGPSAALSGASVAAGAGSRFGGLWIARAVLLLGAGAALAVVRRRTPPFGRGVPLVVAAVGLLGAAAVSAASGHAGAGDTPVFGVALDVVHVGAVAAWMGGLAVLVVLLTARRPPPGADAAVRRFSSVATVAVGLVASTGAALAARTAGSVAALTSTDYGRLVLGKAALFAVLGALGAGARRRVRSRAGVGSVRRVALVEVGVGTVTLGVTAALVSAAPVATSAALPLPSVGAVAAVVPGVAVAVAVALGLRARARRTAAGLRRSAPAPAAT